MNNSKSAQLISPPMPNGMSAILVINLGSSSIKFSIYHTSDLALFLQGEINNIGSDEPSFNWKNTQGETAENIDVRSFGCQSFADFLIDWIEHQDFFSALVAVGHRIVHGMHHTKPERVSTSLLAELHQISPYDPEHLPQQIAMMEAIHLRHPTLVQVACFDTAFHRTMPRVAKLLPIPKRFTDKGIERFGFHGLSYAYLIQELQRLGDSSATKGRVVLAHLGNGASIAAVRDGKSIDTTMCFTPASGLPMSTRSGDLDPGLISYLMQSEQMDSKQLTHLINSECGLLGVSETSSDIRELLQREAEDVRAADAIAMFCYQVKKTIGAYAAALGGIDTLVFSGGIGEHAHSIRARICQGLEFLGIELNSESNAEAAQLISSGRTKVRVIHTNEEVMIAQLVLPLLPTSYSIKKNFYEHH